MLKEQFFQPYPGQEVGYVLVLARTGPGGRVAVIQKKRPRWQAGRFNFPGGKIEADETPAQAAAREMLEEAGLVLSLDSLRPVALLLRRGFFAIYVFATETLAVNEVVTLTDEPISLVDVNTLHNWTPAQCLENLSWLYGMAFDGEAKCATVEYDA